MPIDALVDKRYFKVHDWKVNNLDCSGRKKANPYVAVNHSLEETEEFTGSFIRHRVFSNCDQIVQDAHDKSRSIEKPTKYTMDQQSSSATANQYTNQNQHQHQQHYQYEDSPTDQQSKQSRLKSFRNLSSEALNDKLNEFNRAMA